MSTSRPTPARSRPRRSGARVTGGRAIGTRVIGAAVAALALAVVGSGAAEATPVTYRQYVALGDSYVSSPLTGPSAGAPPGCLRSTNNYPHLVAAQIGAQLTDVSCSGATSREFANRQTTNAGTNPPQYDALSRRADLVSVGIGGNDIGFSDIITTCARLTASMPTAVAPCRDFYTAGGTDTLRRLIDEDAPVIARDLRTVRARTTPRTTILLVGYPAILPPTNTNCPPAVPYTGADVGYLRGVEQYLNAMLARQAGANRARYVDTYTLSVAHHACTLPGTKWVEGLTPTAPAYPVHPNALGQQASARAVLAALR